MYDVDIKIYLVWFIFITIITNSLTDNTVICVNDIIAYTFCAIRL